MASSTKPGFVYLVTNDDYEAMSCYKIGETDSLSSRLHDFNTDTCTMPTWHYLATIECDDSNALEQFFHRMFKEQRRCTNRELFTFEEEPEHGFSIDEVIEIFKKQADLIKGKFIEYEETEIPEVKQPKTVFQLSWLHAAAGDEVSWNNPYAAEGELPTEKFYISAYKGAFGKTYLVDTQSDMNDSSKKMGITDARKLLLEKYPKMKAEIWDYANWKYGTKSLKDIFAEHLINN